MHHDQASGLVITLRYNLQNEESVCGNWDSEAVSKYLTVDREMMPLDGQSCFACGHV
jgi:hypothetical protein